MKRLLKLAASALAIFAAPAAAQDFAITGATVATGDGSEPIENATVLVRGGKIVAAGRDIAVPADVTALDGSGTWITPGLVAAVTDLGLVDVGAVSQSNDRSASDSRYNAALDVAPTINPASQHIKVSRNHGITRAVVVPNQGNAIFAGQGAIIDLGADLDAVRKPRALQMVDLGEGGARLAGGSRAAAHVELHNALAEAIAYANNRWDGSRAMLARMDAKALGPVVSGEQKLFVEVERASDILAVLELKEDFPRLDLVLVGASEGWLVANEIAAAGVPVIADGLDDLPERFEEIASTQSNIGRMVKAGVKVAINAAAMENPRNLNQYAGNLVALTRIPGADGLSWGQAFAAISSIPAEIAGMGSQAGVLAPGAMGDIVVWDGDPLEIGSMPVRVYIDGVEQPLDNHQSRLRDRYRDLDESDLPKAYDW
ncbi:amidohydrolase family protein [Qipengyuania vesicularis]|uniref:amidohydrolase family protein n=1 Tax=Qipengyuania vesicularis TaxID=2867232 RepID=UPI001C8878A3|nr:amidohydrolase family protein [Qipengyuania vesicularis]MBX7528143.1 amidohydrolase family protein [Qipengyuania vesicularis]